MFSQNSDIQSVQHIALDIYKEIQRVCEDNNLRYFSSGGTTIGALLYQGFIPWDDDMDINMPRPDYEQFKQLAPQELSSHLRIFDGLTSNNSDIHFLKVHDARTMFTADILLPYPDCYTGVFVDIEPIDGVPDNKLEREQWYFELEKLYCYDLVRKFGKQYLYPDTMAWLYPNRIKRAIMYAWIQAHPRTYYARLYSRKQQEINTRFPFDQSEYVSWPRYGMYRSKNFWGTKAQDWSAYIEIPFEDTTIRVPSGYKNILTCQYGFVPTHETQKQYEQESDSHHIANGILDIHQSYTIYQEQVKNK